MSTDSIILGYLLVGLIYTLVNGLVRRVETDGDWLLAIVWLLLWPIPFLGLIVLGIIKTVQYVKNFIKVKNT